MELLRRAAARPPRRGDHRNPRRARVPEDRGGRGAARQPARPSGVPELKEDFRCERQESTPATCAGWPRIDRRRPQAGRCGTRGAWSASRSRSDPRGHRTALVTCANARIAKGGDDLSQPARSRHRTPGRFSATRNQARRTRRLLRATSPKHRRSRARRRLNRATSADCRKKRKRPGEKR